MGTISLPRGCSERNNHKLLPYLIHTIEFALYSIFCRRHKKLFAFVSIAAIFSILFYFEEKTRQPIGIKRCASKLNDVRWTDRYVNVWTCLIYNVREKKKRP